MRHSVLWVSWGIILIIIATYGVSAMCPHGCVCDGNFTVRCSGLTTPPQANDLPTNATSLYLRGCNISSLITALHYYTLQTLSITDCQLNFIAEDIFSGMSNLTTLCLDDNSLTLDDSSLSTESFNGLRTLKTLYLRDNRINGSVPDLFFSRLPVLEKVDFSGNVDLTFEASPAWNNSPLTTIVCEMCALTNVTEVAHALSLPMLLSLQLRGNDFKTIPEHAFVSLPGLEDLDVSDCGVETIDGPSSFVGMPRLRSLSLHANRLQTLPRDGLFSNGNTPLTLRTLRLANNRLTSVASDAVSWSSLTVVTLEHNPWNCDCNVAWMREVNLDQFGHVNLTCASPPEFRDQLVQTFPLPCSCPDNSCGGGSSTAVALGIIIPVLVIASLILGCYAYRYLLSRRRRANERKSFRYSAVYRETVESSSNRSILVETASGRSMPLTSDSHV